MESERRESQAFTSSSMQKTGSEQESTTHREGGKEAGSQPQQLTLRGDTVPNWLHQQAYVGTCLGSLSTDSCVKEGKFSY